MASSRNLTALSIALVLLILSAPTARAEHEYEDGEIILSLNPENTIEEVAATWGVDILDSYEEGNLYLVYAEGVDEGLEDLAEEMSEDPAVDWAEANYVQETPEGIRQMVIMAIGGSFVDYEDQEISQRIGLDDAHLVTRGEGMRVAVLDTGIDPLHEAIDGHLAPGGYDFVGDDEEPWEEANGLDDDGDETVDEGFGHGTMVAGIVALVAPASEILPVRVLDDEGRADAFTICKGIGHALLNGSDVINMSFGVPRGIASIAHMIEFAKDSGIVGVAGAGNENREDPAYFPAIHEEAFMVTALDSLDRKADFADWNEEVVVSAPGTGVRSAYPGGEWGLGSGCSFATPFVAGEAALILSLWPGLAPHEVQERIEGAVVPIYDIPENQPFVEALGTGRLYLPDAVNGASSVATETERTFPRPRIFPNPSPGGIRLELTGETGSVQPLRLAIYDAAGRLIHTGEATGRVYAWDGEAFAGRPAASGVYYVVVEAGGRTHHQAIRILR